MLLYFSSASFVRLMGLVLLGGGLGLYFRTEGFYLTYFSMMAVLFVFDFLFFKGLDVCFWVRSSGFMHRFLKAFTRVAAVVFASHLLSTFFSWYDEKGLVAALSVLYSHVFTVLRKKEAGL